MTRKVGRDEAVRRAVRLARREGRDPDDYEPPETSRSGRTWVVRFDGKVPAPGNHFFVHVDGDGDGDARLVPGR